jgi:hypothetical protein
VVVVVVAVVALLMIGIVILKLEVLEIEKILEDDEKAHRVVVVRTRMTVGNKFKNSKSDPSRI